MIILYLLTAFHLPSFGEGLGVCLLAAGLLVGLFFFLFFRHQRSLRRRAYLMREAIRNHDWSFRLTTRGLTSGERAMQEALNDLGEVIHQQVNQSEVESWQRLTRVLTHEMMNSTAPIASITQSLLRRDDVLGTPLEAGIRSIHATASRLTSFVESYRKLAQLQQPKPEDVHLDTFFAEMQRLYPTLAWDIEGTEDIVVHTDPALLQQVVVNLVKNAVEAGATKVKAHPMNESGRDSMYRLPRTLKGREQILSRTGKAAAIKDNHSLPTAWRFATPDTSGREDGRWGFSLFISNNGSPIPAADRDSIFIPFFTTKHEGTGIGLALSRQMMMRQGGDLELMEQPETGYTVTFKLTLS